MTTRGPALLRCHWCGLTDGVHQHGCPHQPKPTCPYVHYSDGGTAHCTLAETRVRDLEAALREIAGEGCNFHTDPKEPWLPAEHGTCQRNGRTELRDERGGYISCCHACYAAQALGLPEVNDADPA